MDGLEIYRADTSAIPTNRGFYFQYLLTLNKWLTNFLSGSNVVTEVDTNEDIVEVGDQIVFTQVKCYTQDFNLNSKDVKKAVLNFFFNYLDNEDMNLAQTFCFETNSGIRVRENTLKLWAESGDEPLEDELLRKCHKRITTILNDQLKTRRRAYRSNQSNKKGFLVAERVYKYLTTKINDPEFIRFTKSIKWIFGDMDPEEGIADIEEKISTQLRSKEFQDIPERMLMPVFLTRIYRASIQVDSKNRGLTKQAINEILSWTLEELKEYVDQRVGSLFDLSRIQSRLNEHELRINTLEQNVGRNTLNVLTDPKHWSKELTFIPKNEIGSVIGRERVLEEIKDKLKVQRILNLWGIAGTGKSVLAKECVSSANGDLKHVVWLNGDETIQKTFSDAPVLLNNLGFINGFSKGLSPFEQVINQLNKTQGTGLIVIDGLKYGAEEDVFKELAALGEDWLILITSKFKVQQIANYLIPTVSRNTAQEIFNEFLEDGQRCPDEDVIKLIESVDFNIKMIELAAKTLNTCLGMELNTLVQLVEEQRLPELTKELDEESLRNGLLSWMKASFELINLEGEEKYFLEWLSILPTDKVPILELVQINGDAFFQKNKKHILKWINSLSSKGWVTRSSGTYSMHSLVQKAIRYEIRRPEMFGLYIIWLSARLNEGIAEHSLDVMRFVKYAESILHSLKNREGIEQPLVILENNLIIAYRKCGLNRRQKDILDLLKRAEVYLEEGDSNLPVIHVNVGLYHISEGAFDQAIKSFERASSLFQESGLRVLPRDLPVLKQYSVEVECNLVYCKMQNEAYPSATDDVQKLIALSEENLSETNPFRLTVLRLVSALYARYGGYEDSMKFSKLTLEAMDGGLDYDHYQLRASVLSDIGTNFIRLNKKELALKYKLKAAECYEAREFHDHEFLKDLYYVIGFLYKELGQNELFDQYLIKSN